MYTTIGNDLRHLRTKRDWPKVKRAANTKKKYSGGLITSTLNLYDIFSSKKYR